MVQFADKITAGKVRLTQDGYLVADACVARVGIQSYLGSELGRPDMSIVRVYRPESEVFSKDTMQSFAYRPMTNNHSPNPVSAENWKDFAVGNTGGEVMRDGDFVRVPLILMDSNAIKDFEAGKRELSMGYEANIIFDSGTTPDGQQYDAIQTDIRNNHLALVSKARGGDALRIGDGHTFDAVSPVLDETPPKVGGRQMAELRKVVVDGLTIETTEQGEQVIAKLQKQIADGDGLLETVQKTHKQAIADKDAELAKKDAEIDTLKTKVLSDEDLDARVTARADLVSVARQVVDEDFTGKSDNEIRVAVVKATFGDAAVEGKSDDYVKARFDIIVEDNAAAGPDPVRTAVAHRTPVADSADKADQDNVTDMQNAWKTGKTA
jgi:hypothetical protein